MASFTDIPETLRDTKQAPQFIHWLIEQPVTFDVRRALAHLWEAHTIGTLSNEDWIRISQAPEPTNGHRE